MNSSENAGGVSMNDCKSTMQHSSLEACTSMDPKDYVWGNLTAGHQSHLFGQFMQMAFMCTAFLPSPMQLACPFPSCPPAPWMMSFPHGLHPSATVPPPASATGATKDAALQQKPPAGSNASATSNTSIAQAKNTEIAGSKINKNKRPMKADSSRNIRKSCKVNEAAVESSFVDEHKLDLQVLEPLDVDDIQQLFQDDLLQDVHGDCFSGASSESNATRYVATPTPNKAHQLSTCISLPSTAMSIENQLLGDFRDESRGDDSLGLAVFDHGFEHLDRDFKGPCSSFDELVDMDALLNMDDSTALAATELNKQCKLKPATASKQPAKAGVCKRTATSTPLTSPALVLHESFQEWQDLLGCGPDSANWPSKISFDDLPCFGL